MPQSVSKVFIHSIFSTKGRQPFIDRSIKDELYSYMAGVMKNNGCDVIKINGPSDHVHILFVLSRTISQSKIIELVKKSSSKWIKTKGNQYIQFKWQAGYGNFGIDISNIGIVKQYIRNQEDHHKVISFQDEFRTYLQKYKIDYDERYIWD